MGKVVSIDKYRIMKEIRSLQESLTARIEYCERNGYVWIDHYTIRQTHEKIGELKRKLEDTGDEGSS
jgi:hypothetical protein